MSRRLFLLKSVLWALVGVLGTVSVARFIHGLGAVSHLSDATPWGLWIGFDVMGGVALAAGGFVLAAAVYIFGLERYRPFVRPAILTAFLGYVAVAVGLMYDLGIPWHIWHPAIYWQYHSVLFEVAACVMLYLTVLTLEFAPVVLEHPRFAKPILLKIHAALKRVTIPLVIAGITLSTLHQSSLGSLFLITPYRLHPLWYSPIEYVLFLVSAVGLGLMTVVLESLLSKYFLHHEVDVRRLAGLGGAAAVVMALYIALRVGDLAIRGVFGRSFDGSWQSVLFVAELGLSAVLPAVLLAVPRIRRSIAGLSVSAALVVGGMVWYRLDVSIIAFARPPGMGYFPSWMEFAVSLGIVSAAALVFIFFAERFKVYHEEVRLPAERPSFQPATLHGLLPRPLAAPRRFSLIAVATAAVTVALLPREAVLGAIPGSTPATRARAVDGFAVKRPGAVRHLTLAVASDVIPPGGEATPLLLIDGNRNGDAVLFDHDAHVKRQSGADSCSVCHHLNEPFDRHPPCVDCHRDMYEPVSAFDHASHVKALHGNAGCVECHKAPHGPKSYATATACVECHADLAPANSFVAAPHDRWHPASGYVDAMHGLCKQCHEHKLRAEPGKHPKTLDRCDTCHDPDRSFDLEQLEPRPRERRPVRAAAPRSLEETGGRGTLVAGGR